MSGASKIEWTEATWNPVSGCTKKSPGCKHCYAKTLHDKRHLAYLAGKKMPAQYAKPFEHVMLHPERLDWPLRWRGSPIAKAAGMPSRIFVNSVSDLFHEDVPDEFIDQVFAVMSLARQHTFQVLTKRADRMHAYLGSQPVPRRRWEDEVRKQQGGELRGNCPVPVLPNVWLGVSAEDQKTFDERVEHLGATSAAVRFVSCEPLLEEIDTGNAFDDPPDDSDYGRIDWVIAGGESGPKARPSHPKWFRSLRDQCKAADVPFFFKQWGEWLPGQNELHPELRHATAHHQDGTWGQTGTKITDLNYVRWDAAGNMRKGGALGEPDCFQVAFWAERVGKKRAGRLLDGVLHDEYPA